MVRDQFPIRLSLCLCCLLTLATGRLTAQGEGAGCDKTLGTTIISHGRNKSVKSPWVQVMAEAIIARAQMEGGTGGTVLRYDPATGGANYVHGSLLPDGEAVLIFNWVEDSGIFVAGNEGSGEAAADACFAALADAHVVDTDGVTPLAGWENFNFLADDRHLHFIGHSRGAVISSATVKRLGSVLNREVEHVTSLDPFPWDPANDPFPATWSHVIWADNYFQDLFFPPFNPTSFPLNGAADFDLSGILAGNGCETFPHNDVPLWYLGTIDLAFQPCPPDVNRDDWYPAGDQHGYWFSDLVCDHVVDRPPTSGPTMDPASTPPIINGNFELGPWAGWRYHGGYLDDDITTGEVSPVFFDDIKSSFVLVLGGLYDGGAQHN